MAQNIKLLIAKFKLKLKKVGKTTRLFRHDPNQIPYEHRGNEKQIQGIRSEKQCLRNYGQRFITLYRRL